MNTDLPSLPEFLAFEICTCSVDAKFSSPVCILLERLMILLPGSSNINNVNEIVQGIHFPRMLFTIVYWKEVRRQENKWLSGCKNKIQILWLMATSPMGKKDGNKRNRSQKEQDDGERVEKRGG